MKLSVAKMTIAIVTALSIPVAFALPVVMTAQEKQLYEAAKKEGSVTWYTSQAGTQWSEQTCAMFTARYPGVACNSVRATSQVIFQRLIQETKAKAIHADVLSSNSVADLLILRKEKQLASFHPENERFLAPKIKLMVEKNGYWMPTQVAPLGIVYNKNLVKPADAPKQWRDLLDPKWQGQAAVAHPGFSGSVGVWVLAMKKLYGDAYFEKLAKNKPQIGRSVLDGMNLVISGERKVALAPLNTAEKEASKGAPLVMVYPSDGVVLALSGSAILKEAPHPNAARLFMEFSLGTEMSKFLTAELRNPLRSDIAGPTAVPTLDQIKILTVPDDEVMSGANDAKEMFRDVFGI